MVPSIERVHLHPVHHLAEGEPIHAGSVRRVHDTATITPQCLFFILRFVHPVQCVADGRLGPSAIGKLVQRACRRRISELLPQREP